MRLRILELPSQQDGDDYHTPYVLVIDRVADLLTEELRGNLSEQLKATTGARGVMVISAEMGDLELE